MQRFSVKLLLSLAVAPGILLIFKLFDLQSESLSYIFLRLIPAFISSFFFLFFLNAYIYKKNLILYFTQKFYHKKLTKTELEFLSNSDLYWVGTTLLNTMIQALMGIYADDTLWVFYSSIGWYIYLFIALTVHIVYGKIYALKRGQND